MAKIVYFHGFASSGASGTVLLLRKHFRQHRVLAPDIPLDPAEALPFLKDFCAREEPDLIIGSSMGGMYAQQMRGFLRICVNPAFYMSKLYNTVRIGVFEYTNKREDGQKKGHITKEIIAHLKEMEEHQFEGITPDEQELCIGLFGRDDDRVHGYDDFMKYYTHAQWFDGGHRLNDKIVSTVVEPIITDWLG
ncbi:MAG: hypothetical protein K6C31_00825 [Bacteroidales bacterium]|jgi:predicted esterase YcpF (UPF0227 family)|nr:hypothetical protein [Bacteroidales bacterium]